MPDTLADLTLRYSRDLSALQAECRSRLSRIADDLRLALEAMTGARPLVAAVDRAREAAAAARDDAIGQADVGRRVAQAQAQRRRRDDLTDAQRQYLDADRLADDRKQASTTEIGHAYQARLREIDRTMPLDRQAVERRKAFDEYQQAVAATNEAWKQALVGDRDKQQANLYDALDKERRALDQADTQRAAIVQAAETAFQHAVSTAERRFAEAVSGVPGASHAQSEFLRQQEAARRDGLAREEALVQSFREGLNRLGAGAGERRR